jgi:hypothetical protein
MRLLLAVTTYRPRTCRSRVDAREIHGGDRLPWIPFDRDAQDVDNFVALASLDWQVHVYGAAAPEVRAVCGQRDLALHQFRWEPPMRRAGFRRNALYLVRPDGYVALAAADQSPAVLASYLDARGLR